MLGINPGLDEDLPADYELQSDNCLLGDPTDAEVSLVGGAMPEGGRGARTWTKFVGHTAWGEFDVLQVPHFSVCNSLVGLQECGEWLTTVLCQGATS